ncbi:DUF6255 family natural product biosynthesis protein [Streptomyces luteireticuli]|uniref:DUF6255 family natural product biosynthesis protein n=1 Tax=Streptomyces luteireticuli TaxID=173858 RepID=UPI003557F5BF
MHAVGRLMSHCQHLSGWESTNGEDRCPTCGTRRFTDYGALRPKELPQAVAPSPHDRAAATVLTSAAGAAARRDPSRWRERKPDRPAP